ncbi:NAD(P)H-quinone oxidoreductase [Alkalihalobacterium alkalinitrilicum]|uniref:NAD(P)H-quinone oxidoreductase n=1 Tax=Alkalihalobacterium alkalinitrilicum TaxID=427920 RepID=UPI0009958953|nr:NAD(P)H-quinone oxidoreductase [Alkalihalobacterium alkalinitrilicum]
MKAVLVDEQTKELYLGDFEDPQCGEDELLVSVKATALNRADLLQKKGLYPPPKGESPILGLEMAGVVEKVGAKVNDWEIGDRVFALLPGGGYAEKARIPASMAMRMPDNFSFEQAAAIPEAYLTAYLKMIQLGELSEGEIVLIHAGASGVGTAAIQLAKEKGATSIVTAGSAEKLEACISLGADYTINYKEESFSERVLDITDGKGVQVILDFIGASYWDDNVKSIAVDGRWIIIAALGGYQKEINIRDILMKRIQIKGSTLRSRTIEEKVKLTQDFYNFSSDRFEDGRLVPVIDTVFDWAEAEASHKCLEDNKNIGKVILKIG